MSHKSLLTKEAADEILQTARQNKVKDGELSPALFLHIAVNNLIIMPVFLPHGSDKRTTYFVEVGRNLRRNGIIPSEALLLTEGWFVAVQETPAALKFAPSQHPARQEAIFLVGRDAGDTRFTHVIQPMSSADGQRPRWHPLAHEAYNLETVAHTKPYGLLDALFAGIRQQP